MPYTKTSEYPSHGIPDSTEDMTGGPGFSGLENLATFVKEGGTLVPLENSAAIIAELGIGGRFVDSYNPASLFHPGSVVTVKARNNGSPILYGYPETFHLFKGNSRLLRTPLYRRDLMVLQYGTQPLADEKEYQGEIMGMESVKEDKEKGSDEDEAGNEPYVLSGMVRNEQEITGHGAIFNLPVEKGRIIYFTFNPLHRYLNHHDSSLLWNVLINWDSLDK